MKKLVLTFTLCLFTFVFSAHAAVTYYDSIAATGAGVTTLGVSHTISGSNGRLLASMHYNSAGSVTDCDNDAVALSSVGISTGSDGTSKVEVWSLANPVSGTVTCNFSALAYVVLGVSNFIGAGSLGTATEGTQTSFVSSNIDVTGVAGGLVVDFIVNTSGSTMTADGSQTVIIDNVVADVNQVAGASYKGGTGTLTMIWTWPDGAYNAHVGVLINPSVAAVTTRRRAVIVQ